MKDFSIPEHWPRAYGLDIRWNAVGVIWGARDPQTDVLYLYAEYLAETDSAIHAAAIRSRGEWVPGLLDAKANGRTDTDGIQLIRVYRNLGLNLQWAHNPIESGILKVRERMNSGRLKIFASLTKYLDERRRYRCDNRGRIVSLGDNAAGRRTVSGEWDILHANETEPAYHPNACLRRR